MKQLLQLIFAFLTLLIFGLGIIALIENKYPTLELKWVFLIGFVYALFAREMIYLAIEILKKECEKTQKRCWF